MSSTTYLPTIPGHKIKHGPDCTLLGDRHGNPGRCDRQGRFGSEPCSYTPSLLDRILALTDRLFGSRF